MLTALPSIGSRFPPAFSLFRGLFALHIVCFSFPYTMARNVLAVVAGAGALAVQNPVIADVWVGMMPRRLPVSRFLACQAGTLAQYFMTDFFAQFAEHRDRPDAGADLGPSAEPDPRVALSFEVILLLCVLQLLFLIIKRMSAQSQPVINVFIDKVRQSVNGSLRARVDHGTPVSVAAVPLVSQPAERPAGTKHSDESQFVCSKCEVHIDTCELAQFTECFHVLHKSCSRFCVACMTEGLKGRAWCPECLRSHISTHLTSNPVLSETPPRKMQFEESVPPFLLPEVPAFPFVCQTLASPAPDTGIDVWNSVELQGFPPRQPASVSSSVPGQQHEEQPTELCSERSPGTNSDFSSGVLSTQRPGTKSELVLGEIHRCASDACQGTKPCSYSPTKLCLYGEQNSAPTET